MNKLEQMRYCWRQANCPEGAHSWDLREAKVHNPSQRYKDIASKGVEMWTRRESHNGSNGSRYWTAKYRPEHGAVQVAPNLTGGSLLPDPVNPEIPSGTPPVAARPDSAGSAGGEALILDFTGEHVEGAEVLPHGTRVYVGEAA